MKTAFLFSGQGAQYPGMMKDIIANNADAKAVFDVADRSLDRKISMLCFEGSQEELNLTHNTQPCVLAADLAALASISSYGIKADAVAGFSLGEYAALVAAGVIRMEDVFPIIQKRADFMQNAVPVGNGAMAAIMKLSEGEILALCDEVDGYVAPANYNCPGQIVVSGESQAVDELLKIAKEKRIRAMKLPVSAPFHCEMMAPAAENLRGPLSSITMTDASIPVYMNVDAEVETDSKNILEKLVLQAKSPVRWESTLRRMFESGINTFVELGPGTTLSGFVKKTFKKEESIRVLSVTDIDTLKHTVEILKET